MPVSTRSKASTPAPPAPSSSSAQQQHNTHVAAMYVEPKPALKAHLLLVALSLLPTVLPSLVPANILIVLTASLCVYAGAWRSVKPAPPTEVMSRNVGAR